MTQPDEATPIKLTTCGECGQPNLAPDDFHDINSCAAYAVKSIEPILERAGWSGYSSALIAERDAALALVETMEIDHRLEREVMTSDIGNLGDDVSDLERDKQQLYEKGTELNNNWYQAKQQVIDLREALVRVKHSGDQHVMREMCDEALAATAPEATTDGGT